MYKESDRVLVNDYLQERGNRLGVISSWVRWVYAQHACLWTRGSRFGYPPQFSTRMRLPWGWSLVVCRVSLWVWGPRRGESGSASHLDPTQESSSLLHLNTKHTPAYYLFNNIYLTNLALWLDCPPRDWGFAPWSNHTKDKKKIGPDAALLGTQHKEDWGASPCERLVSCPGGVLYIKLPVATETGERLVCTMGRTSLNMA